MLFKLTHKHYGNIYSVNLILKSETVKPLRRQLFGFRRGNNNPEFTVANMKYATYTNMTSEKFVKENSERIFKIQICYIVFALQISKNWF